MAELHVQRKRNSYLWLWLVIILIILFIAGYFIYNHNNHQPTMNTKPISQLQTGFSFTKTMNYV